MCEVGHRRRLVVSRRVHAQSGRCVHQIGMGLGLLRLSASEPTPTICPGASGVRQRAGLIHQGLAAGGHLLHHVRPDAQHRQRAGRGRFDQVSDEEIAFYDALAENDSAVQMMGDDKLKLIAHELLMSLRDNVSVDWAHRDSARARMRVLVKRILRKYGYPPDLQDTAVQTVLQQAEALSSGWSVSRSGGSKQ